VTAITWHNETRRIKELIPYEANPRQITAKQAKDLKSSLQKFGIADPIIINTDNGIIGGHQRKKILETLLGYDPDYEIDVRVPDRELGIDEARELNVRLNKNVGEFDFDILANNFELDDLLEWGFEKSELDLDLWQPAIDGETDEEPEAEESLVYRVPDAVWGSDNEYGIPMLDLNKQATCLEAPFMAWGTQARKNRMTGTYHFYVSDDRFEALWRDPVDVANSACSGFVEVNFSVYDDMPKAVAIWQMYRKRWITRWLQSLDIPAIVDLNISHVHAGLRFVGVPKGWKSYATRAYSARLDETIAEYEAAVEHAGTSSILFVVYGGGKSAEELCRERGWLWYQDQQSKDAGGKRNG
jgi:hypothetical protein